MLPSSDKEMKIYADEVKKASDFVTAFPGLAYEFATIDAEKFTAMFKLLRTAASCQIEAMEIAHRMRGKESKAVLSQASALFESEKNLNLDSLNDPGFDQLKQAQPLPREGTVFSYLNEEGNVNKLYLDCRFTTKSI